MCEHFEIIVKKGKNGITIFMLIKKLVTLCRRTNH